MEIKSTTLQNGVTYGNVDFKCDLETKDSNNCSVRALATAFEKSYKMAFMGAQMLFDRKRNEGALGFAVERMHKNEYLWDKKVVRMGKVVEGDEWKGKQIGKVYHVGAGEKKFRRMSTGTFFKTYKEGTFILVVKGHMFTVKDGEVLGNRSDATMLKRPIEYAFAIGRKANRVNRIIK
tara:strand:- start:747 stop:1280 length:534 start_codon:yes stop_codon:yes gene_type:complete